MNYVWVKRGAFWHKEEADDARYAKALDAQIKRDLLGERIGRIYRAITVESLIYGDSKWKEQVEI